MLFVHTLPHICVCCNIIIEIPIKTVHCVGDAWRRTLLIYISHVIAHSIEGMYITAIGTMIDLILWISPCRPAKLQSQLNPI